MTGSEWAERVAARASQHGLETTFSQLSRVIGVEGVGSGSQQCKIQGEFPVDFFRCFIVSYCFPISKNTSICVHSTFALGVLPVLICIYCASVGVGAGAGDV